MKNYEVKCHYCGEVFQSQRKDTKYCSDSCRVMASRERKKENMPDETSISVRFTTGEYEILSKTAKSAGISVEDMVKFRGLMDIGDVESKNRKIKSLKEELTKLKAHLSVYTKHPGTGVFLPVNEDTKKEMQYTLADLVDDDEPDWSFEDKLIYLATNFPLYFFVEELNWKLLPRVGK